MEAIKGQAKLDAQNMDRTFAGFPHDVSVDSGAVWPTVDNAIREHHIDMIVMGTHGRSSVSRAVMGSFAEEVFRQASCPVLTVGPHISKNTERRLGMKQILFATDFSDQSLCALPYAVSLAQEHQAKLT